eukprot:scaffold17674_cov148-Skeletonema_marinoi.AAC.2
MRRQLQLITLVQYSSTKPKRHWDRSHDQLGGAAIGGNKTKKRQKDDVIAFDLIDVPPQPPIPKSDVANNKWKAQINIGHRRKDMMYWYWYNENEKEAAVDYARAVFKYYT